MIAILISVERYVYRVAQKNGTVDTVDFSGLCSDQQLFFFTLLDRASFPHYNNTKIIKFGWELFILWVITYGLSFSGFAIDLSLIVPRNSGNRANPEMTVHKKLLIKLKVSTKFDYLGVIIMRKRCSIQQGEKGWLLIRAKSWKIDCIDCSVFFFFFFFLGGGGGGATRYTHVKHTVFDNGW